MSDVSNPTAPRRQAVTKERTAEEIARACLAEAHNNVDRAHALAGKRARGAKLRHAYVLIGNIHRQGKTTRRRAE